MHLLSQFKNQHFRKRSPFNVNQYIKLTKTHDSKMRKLKYIFTQIHLQIYFTSSDVLN